MADGFLKVPAVTTIYTSGHDSALGLSRWIFHEQRLGELANAAISSQTVRDFLLSTDDIYVVDVTDAEGSARGNGHAYFRNSPWASSDLLMTLMYNLSPRERGLVRPDGELAWIFPPDYISRLRQAIFKANPDLAEIIQDSVPGPADSQ